MKSTLLVMLAKLMLSPYTPVMAYFAVFFQGSMGELLYSFKTIKHISCFILSIVTVLFSSLQKILVMTIIFGFTLWKSIDNLLNYISRELFISNFNFSFSYYLISAYILIHLIAGLLTAVFILRFLKGIPELLNNKLLIINVYIDNNKDIKSLNNRKKKIKISKILFLLFLLSVLLISYISPEKFNLDANSVLIMILRGILIFIIWFKVLSPVILHFIRKLFDKKKNKYSEAVSGILIYESYIKNLVLLAWKKASSKRKLKRFIYFLKLIVINSLLYKPESDQEAEIPAKTVSSGK